MLTEQGLYIGKGARENIIILAWPIVTVSSPVLRGLVKQ